MTERSLDIADGLDRGGRQRVFKTAQPTAHELYNLTDHEAANRSCWGATRAEASLHMNGHAIGLTGDITSADWLQLIRAEYAEVPGLHLTKPEAEDLWDLDPCVCDALLNALVDTGFLRRTSDDTYVRDQ